MQFKFKSIEIKNLLSFGNQIVSFDFTEGMVLITGDNGVGKSSLLLDAISFLLYDKPYRDINKNDLINRTNKKDLYVGGEFSVDNHDYIIRRGLKNKSVDLEFFIDGVKQELLSTKSLNQAEIIKHIGIDYKMFKQIISLSINYNKPFLSLPAGEKRELIEKFFNIDVIAKMLKKAKDDLKTLNMNKKLLEQSIDTVATVIAKDKKHILELEKLKSNYDTDTDAKITELQNELKNKLEYAKELKQEGKDKTSEYKKIDIRDMNELDSVKNEFVKLKNKLEYDIESAETIIHALSENDVCPSCKSELTEEHKFNELYTQNCIISNAKSEITTLDYKISSITNDIKINKNKYDSKVALSYDIKSVKSKYISVCDEIDTIKRNLEDTKNSTFDVDIKSLKRELKTITDKHKLNKIEFLTIKDDIRDAERIRDILSDSGIKSYIFSQLIPVLNKSVNYYLDLFEIPILIEFDKSMSDTITTLTGSKNVSYYSFSEGEKKKIDMSILLSFIDVTKKIANWNCNLLIIDELLDSSIDEDGLDKLLNSLSLMIDDNSSEIGIYIISHRLKSNYEFDSVLKVEKNKNGFSTINKIE